MHFGELEPMLHSKLSLTRAVIDLLQFSYCYGVGVSLSLETEP